MTRRWLVVVPNAITFSSMLCGFFAIRESIHGNIAGACTAILISSVLDTMDGWVARMTRQTSDFGMYFDSVSDFVSFSCAPAAVLYSTYLHNLGLAGSLACVAFMLCGGYRLVRFSIQAKSVEKKQFTGIPTTAAAIITASGLAISIGPDPVISLTNHTWLFLTVLLAALMVSRVPYGSLKSIQSEGKRRIMAITIPLIGFIIAIVLLGPLSAIFLTLLLYMISPLFTLIRRLFVKPHEAEEPPVSAAQTGLEETEESEDEDLTDPAVSMSDDIGKHGAK